MIRIVKGQKEVVIDNKGRIIIPTKFRSYFDDKATLSLVKGPCIFVFNDEAWERFLRREGLEDFSVMDEEKSSFANYLSSNAEDCPIDKQNRILIPLSHREFALLKDTAFISSSLHWLEIWNKDNWLKVSVEHKKKFGKRMPNNLENIKEK